MIKEQIRDQIIKELIDDNIIDMFRIILDLLISLCLIIVVQLWK